MNNLPKIPSIEVRNRLIENSRCARLGLAAVGLMQNDLIAKLNKQIECKRLDRIDKCKQKAIENRSSN